MGVREDLEGLDGIYRLKSTYRMGTVGDRKESTAEHTWGCLMVAELLLSKLEKPIDEKKVFDLLLYHDLVEAECGDTPLGPGLDRKDKLQKELEAAEKLREELPEPIASRFYELFMEFEQQETRESRFAKLVDGFEADTFTRNCNLDWKGWSKEFHDSKRREQFSDFPELLVYLDELQHQLIQSGILEE